MIWLVLWLIILAIGIFADEYDTPVLKNVCLFVTLAPLAVGAVVLLIVWFLQ